MGTKYRISYTDDAPSTRTIDLYPGDKGFNIFYKFTSFQNPSISGVYETIEANTLRFADIDFYMKEAEYRQMLTFMAYARRGNTFSIIDDSTKAFRSDLDGVVSSGDASITVTAATNAADNMYIRIYDPLSGLWDETQITDITSLELTVVPTPAWDYPDAAIVQYSNYIYAATLLEKEFKPTKVGSYYHYTMSVVEGA
jgi:hypothetical protein